MMTIFLSLIGETPQTLGIDRMVLAAGATLQFPGMNRLVMMGTCVTFDFIDETP
jgi:type III pantothenate kinase